MTSNTAGNSTYKKLAVQCLNEVLCFVLSFVVAENFVLRNRQLLVAAKRQVGCKPKTDTVKNNIWINKNSSLENFKRNILDINKKVVILLLKVNTIK